MNVDGTVRGAVAVKNRALDVIIGRGRCCSSIGPRCRRGRRWPVVSGTLCVDRGVAVLGCADGAFQFRLSAELFWAAPATHHDQAHQDSAARTAITVTFPPGWLPRCCLWRGSGVLVDLLSYREQGIAFGRPQRLRPRDSRLRPRSSGRRCDGFPVCATRARPARRKDLPSRCAGDARGVWLRRTLLPSGWTLPAAGEPAERDAVSL